MNCAHGFFMFHKYNARPLRASSVSGSGIYSWCVEEATYLIASRLIRFPVCLAYLRASVTAYVLSLLSVFQKAPLPHFLYDTSL